MTNGYQRIPIDQDAADRRRLADERGHHREASSGSISGTLEAKVRVIRPVHVGTGDLVVSSALKPLPTNPQHIPLIAPFFREGEQVCVPGSSIKGAIRHLYEMVTASCLAQADTRTKTGRPVDDQLKGCSFRADSRYGKNMPNLCPACRVFGAQGYLGQVFFQSVYPIANTKTEVTFAPQRWSPRIIEEDSRKLYTHEPALNENNQDQPYELREPLEVLPVDSVLILRMDFTALLPAELGLLLLLMGQQQDNKIYPKLGAVKAHGWGAVDIYDVAIYRMNKYSYLSYERTSSMIEDMQPYFSSLEASDLLNIDAWAQVAEHLKLGGGNDR